MSLFLEHIVDRNHALTALQLTVTFQRRRLQRLQEVEAGLHRESRLAWEQALPIEREYQLCREMVVPSQDQLLLVWLYQELLNLDVDTRVGSEDKEAVEWLSNSILELLTSTNLGLVYTALPEWVPREKQDEYVSVALETMVHALQLFNTESKIELSTYLTASMKYSMVRWSTQNRYELYYSYRRLLLMNWVERLRKQHKNNDQIAAELNITVESVKSILGDLDSRYMSLDEIADNDQGLAVEESLLVDNPFAELVADSEELEVVIEEFGRITVYLADSELYFASDKDQQKKLVEKYAIYGLKLLNAPEIDFLHLYLPYWLEDRVTGKTEEEIAAKLQKTRQAVNLNKQTSFAKLSVLLKSSSVSTK